MPSSFDIELRDMHIYAYHGVFSQESSVGNEFIVNLSVSINADPDLEFNDNLDATISYADLYDIVSSEMAKQSKLLETVALRIASKIKLRWNIVKKGRISIEKTSPPIPGFTGNACVILNF